MTKVLIIGQAPPTVKQEVPYDTTLLYEIFSWVGIDKDAAQRLFEFEACIGFFPGYDEKGGHKKPTQQQVTEHYEKVLKAKIITSRRIIFLGAVAGEYFDFIKHSNDPEFKYIQWIQLPHPSRRNYALIMNKKNSITCTLKQFLYNE